jgi:hypothetical protein
MFGGVSREGLVKLLESTRPEDRVMLVLGLLSDAQEVLNVQDGKETARQLLNMVKFLAMEGLQANEQHAYRPAPLTSTACKRTEWCVQQVGHSGPCKETF